LTLSGVLFDNPVSRAMARRLEAEQNALLGTAQTKRIARSFNQTKNRRYREYRDEQYRDHLNALYEENGTPPPEVARMSDGWAIDTSRTFPHLDRLLSDVEEIIAERGGVDRGGGDRAFFQQLLDDDCVARYPSILDFATSNQVLKPVIDYLGFIPTLSGTLPLGARLNESDGRFVPDWDGQYRQSQLFHCDYHDSPMVYVIATLRDVTPENGPFCFLSDSVSAKAARALRYGEKGTPYRITDSEMYRVASKDDLHEFCQPAGAVLFVDNSRCFHYGSRNPQKPRYMMMYAYVSVCRTDFTDILRPESKARVSDKEARVKRSKYPTREGDSRLRKMILDREYLG